MIEPNHGNRRARFLVTPELIAALGQGMYEVVENPLPPDATVKGAGYDYESGCLSIVVESESFHAVPEGGVLPITASPRIREDSPLKAATKA